VIPAIHPRGANVGGLLRYLFGPGRREEHVDARLVAAWSTAADLADLEPPTAASGCRDVRQLTELLEQPVAVGRNPPRKPVWHCSIRTHPTDRRLSDGQWAHIAREVLAAVGLAPHGDDRAVRWVAVRHAEDHIHVVATLVRQDRRTAWPSFDYPKAQQACRDLEERYGLYRVSPPGEGTRSWPRPAELNKAARLHAGGNNARPRATKAGRSSPGNGVVAARESLRRQVRAVAAAASSESDFFDRLATAGVLVKLRRSTITAGQVSGYAVGLPDHTTGAGATVWYSGGKLAADLSLPRLRTRWPVAAQPEAGSPAVQLAALAFPAPPPRTFQRAADAAARAAAALNPKISPVMAAAITRSAADVLAVTARRWEGRRGGPLTKAAELLDRTAAHQGRRAAVRSVTRGTYAAHLGLLARRIALLQQVDGAEDLVDALHLALAMARLADSLADLFDTWRQAHQAQAARSAADYLRTFTPPDPPLRAARPGSGYPRQAPAGPRPQPVADRWPPTRAPRR